VLFTEINEIRREFGINEHKPEEIRSRLRTLQSELHPDRTGGEFQEGNDKERFLRVSAALDYIEKHETNESALVPVSMMADLLKVIRDLVPAQQEKNAETALNTSVATKLTTLHTQYKTPRITTSAISIVLSAIWLFPNQIADHPVLGHYLDTSSITFSVLWFYSVVITAMIWVRTSMHEEKRKRFLGIIKTEGWQNERFMKFVSEINFDEDDKKRFTKDSFMRDLVCKQPIHRSLFLQFRFQRPDELDPELAQGIVDSVVGRAEQRGLIAKDLVKTLSETYYVC